MKNIDLAVNEEKFEILEDLQFLKSVWSVKY